MGQRSNQEIVYVMLRGLMLACAALAVGGRWLISSADPLSLAIYLAGWCIMSSAVLYNMRGRYVMLAAQCADMALLAWLVWRNGGNASPVAFLLLPQAAAMAMFSSRTLAPFCAVGLMLFHWYVEHQMGRPGFYSVAFWFAYGFAALWPAYFAVAGQSIQSLRLRLAALQERERYLERALSSIEGKYEKSSVVDEVTGLNNFRYFRDRIDKEVKRGLRQKYIFSLCILTVDDLEIYEKKFGVAERDMALGRIARQVIKAMRDTDLIARFQNNGFAFLLPDTEPRRSVVPAVRLRDKLTALQFGSEGNFHFNISIGVAGFPSDASDVAGIIGAATAAVHRSAARGANQITLASSLFRNLA